MGQVPEAAVWMLFSGGLFGWEFTKLRRQVRQKEEYDKLHFISDAEEVVTEDFSLTSASANSSR